MDFYIRCSECKVALPWRKRVLIEFTKDGEIAAGKIDEREKAVEEWNRRT